MSGFAPPTATECVARARELAGRFRERLTAEVAAGAISFPHENIADVKAARCQPGRVLLPADDG
jgi:hypothetical protein